MNKSEQIIFDVFYQERAKFVKQYNAGQLPEDIIFLEYLVTKIRDKVKNKDFDLQTHSLLCAEFKPKSNRCPHLVLDYLKLFKAYSLTFFTVWVSQTKLALNNALASLSIMAAWPFGEPIKTTRLTQ